MRKLGVGAVAITALAAGSSARLGHCSVSALGDEEMRATVGGAQLYITSPGNGTYTSTIDNPLFQFTENYTGTDQLTVSAMVNGTKTSSMIADYKNNWGYNSMYTRMPFPPPATANIEIKWCNQSADPNTCPLPAASGSRPTVTFTWSNKLKIAGVNFWNVTVGSSSASFSGDQMLNATDPTDVNLRPWGADAVLAGEWITDPNVLYGADINCSFNSIWQFAFRQVRSLTLTDPKCLTPTITAPGYPSLGPSPSCPSFSTLVTAALSAADSHYGDYVNVVVVNDLTLFDPATNKYTTNTAEGYHPAGANWFALNKHPDSLGPAMVHEWGHQVGLGHAPSSECQGLAGQPVMCSFTGFGVNKAFCDAISQYTGTKNFNPIH